MRFDLDLLKFFIFVLAVPECATKSGAKSDDRSCSALESKSIYMNEDILELMYTADHLSGVKHSRKNDQCQKSHVTEKIKDYSSDKKKQQRRLKGSKRMRKNQKKKQRWKRHKQKMRWPIKLPPVHFMTPDLIWISNHVTWLQMEIISWARN